MLKYTTAEEKITCLMAITQKKKNEINFSIKNAFEVSTEKKKSVSGKLKKYIYWVASPQIFLSEMKWEEN